MNHGPDLSGLKFFVILGMITAVALIVGACAGLGWVAWVVMLHLGWL